MLFSFEGYGGGGGMGVIYSFEIESKRKDVLYWRRCVS